MTQKSCENCVYFDDSKHKLDSRTLNAGICHKMAQIVFKNDKACRTFEPVQNSLNDLEVIEPVYVLPNSQMSMYDIINFIN